MIWYIQDHYLFENLVEVVQAIDNSASTCHSIGYLSLELLLVSSLVRAARQASEDNLLSSWNR